MVEITITDVPGFDGKYEWDGEQQLNGHELHIVKKVSGVRLGEIEEALAAGDYDLIVALTAIMVWRSGKVTRAQVPELVDLLLDAEGGKFVIAEADAADPPAEAPPETVSSGDGNVSSIRSSVGSSSTGDDPPAIIPRAIGSPG